MIEKPDVVVVVVVAVVAVFVVVVVAVVAVVVVVDAGDVDVVAVVVVAVAVVVVVAVVVASENCRTCTVGPSKRACKKTLLFRVFPQDTSRQSKKLMYFDIPWKSNHLCFYSRLVYEAPVFL